MPIASLIVLTVLANCITAVAVLLGVGAFVSMPISIRDELHNRARKRAWLLFTLASVSGVIAIALHTLLGFYK